ncbi:MAG: TMEM165/GDT1 family protein [Chloroflexota bacterium]
MAAVAAAFVLTFVAELGDKTQFMVMAFATRYGMKQVLLGASAGIVASMTFAVLVGSLLATIVPAWVIQLVAGFAFIGFGLWTLKGGDDEEEGSARSKLSPFWTVFTAIFIGEMGDKTQLTAAVLAAQNPSPLLVWLGTTSGMIVADGLGVLVGAMVGKRVPQRIMNYIAAAVFLFFGVLTLVRGVPPEFVTPTTVFWSVTALAGLALLILRRPAKRGQMTTGE